MILDFYVPGTPKPAGSKRGFATKSGRIAMVDSSGQAGKDQRHDIRCAAQDAMNGRPPETAPVAACITFYFPRPKSHYGIGKNAGMKRMDAPHFHTKKPDADKLCRQVLDGLTGIVYVDDSQVWKIEAAKAYSSDGGAGTRIWLDVKGGMA